MGLHNSPRGGGGSVPNHTLNAHNTEPGHFYNYQVCIKIAIPFYNKQSVQATYSTLEKYQITGLILVRGQNSLEARKPNNPFDLHDLRRTEKQLKPETMLNMPNSS